MEEQRQQFGEAEVRREFMALMTKKGMGDQAQELMMVLENMNIMQMQLSVVIRELSDIKEQLSQSQRYPEILVREQASTLHEKAVKLSEQLGKGRKSVIETAKNVIKTFHDKGRRAMRKAVETAKTGAAKVLVECEKQMNDIYLNCASAEARINDIGNELKQIGNSTANIGRLLSGKDAREVSKDVPGVALTRAINEPIKKLGSIMVSHMAKIHKMLVKLGYREEIHNVNSKEGVKQGEEVPVSAEDVQKDKSGEEMNIQDRQEQHADRKEERTPSLLEKLHQKQEEVSKEKESKDNAKEKINDGHKNVR